jgi:hypothetical protein
MHNLSRKSVDMLYKSCRVFHQESNKIGLVFVYFSMILYRFNKFHQICYNIEDAILRWGPRKDLKSHRYAIGSRKRPQKEINPCNWVLGKGGGELAGICRLRRRSRPGKRQGSTTCSPNARGWPALGQGSRWRGGAAGCGLAAAAARLWRWGEHGLANVWHEEHQGILGEASKVSHGCGSG